MAGCYYKKEINKMNNKNPKSHFYLYAKGWYERTNLVDDLIKIMANYTGLKPEQCNINDVKLVLIQEVYKYVLGNNYLFAEFINNVEENGVLEACLSVFVYATVDTSNIEKNPDYSILPMRRYFVK